MPELNPISRALMIAGGLIFAGGLVLWLVGRVPYLGRLPGDITFRRGSTTVYVPIVTALLISILLTIVINLILRR